MSLDNFTPTVWHAKLLKQLDESHNFAAVANREYEGTISDVGDTVKINSIGDITINDYNKESTSISPEQLSDASTRLTIDQSKYFAFEVDDIDQAQNKPKVMQRAIEKAGIGLVDVADEYMADMYDQAGITPSEEDWSSSVDIQGATGKIMRYLMENNVPSEARIWWIVPPEVYTDSLVDITDTLTDNVSELRNGVVGSVYGVDILVSNNLTGDGSNTSEYQTMAGTYSALGYAEQIKKVEGYRPEDSFSDAVKGLHLYGAKVIRPEQLVNLPVQTS